MVFSEINPFVRFVNRVSRQHEVCATTNSIDNRLFYSLSEGSILAEGKQYNMRLGSVLITKPEHSYLIKPTKCPMEILVINFDYTQDNIDTRGLLPVVESTKFRKEDIIEKIEFTDYSINNPFFVESATRIKPYLDLIQDESTNYSTYSQQIMDSLLRIIILTLFRQHTVSDNTALEVQKYIQNHFMEQINLSKIASYFGYHPNHINRLFISMTGMPVHQYIIRLRIRLSMELLSNTELKIEEIALRCGFYNASHFSRCFSQKTGVTPSSFRSIQI